MKYVFMPSAPWKDNSRCRISMVIFFRMLSQVSHILKFRNFTVNITLLICTPSITDDTDSCIDQLLMLGI